MNCYKAGGCPILFQFPDWTELSTMIVEEEDGSITLGCKVDGKWLTAGQPEIKWHKFSKRKALDDGYVEVCSIFSRKFPKICSVKF